jgi:UDP-3-O-[3-hydroxymyristoyl] glucosamine N-acyltransferase
VQLTAREIAGIVGGTLAGNPDTVVTGIAGIKEARAGEATFVGSPKYASAIKTTHASVIIIADGMNGEAGQTLIRVENPGKAFERLVARMAPPPIQLAPGIHPTAVIAGTAKLGREVTIQPYVVIEDGVTVGDRVTIGAGSYIGHESTIGDDCRLHPRVTLRERVHVGCRVVIHSGVTLGADGFGYEFASGQHKKIPQVGNVEIGDDVEIGANTTIDRARFGTTRIGNGTKIDNLVQIGHNCVIGEHCIICGLVGMAGSTILGNYVTIAGQVGLAGHLTIGDKSIIMAQAGVTKDVAPGSFMLGAPAVPHQEFKRSTAAFHRLPEAAVKLRELEQQLAAMRERLDTMK